VSAAPAAPLNAPPPPELGPEVLPEQWARLHPLSPLVRFARALAVLAVAFGPSYLARLTTRAGDGQYSVRFWFDVAVPVVGVIAGVITWFVTRWRVSGRDLQIETGLLRRQSLRIPLARLQAVDVVRPLAARLLGLSELRVTMAGGGSGHGRLAYLPQARALEVRARLLALSRGLPGQTPEPPQQQLLAVDNGRLIVSTLLGGPAMVVLALVAGAVTSGLLTHRIAPALAAFLPPLLTLGLLVARRVNSEFSQRVALAPDGLRVAGGLLESRAETIPAGRVQAWRWSEPLLWRPFGWVRLEVDVAQQRGGRRGDKNDTARVQRALLPVGTRAQARMLLALIATPVDPLEPLVHRPPRRARLKAPLSFPNLGFHYDAGFVLASSGRLSRQVVLVPLMKVQSLRTVQGPLARRLGLATLHLDVAGHGWRAAGHARDAVEVAGLLDELTVLSRRARRASG